jgi:hypothetical protein
MSDSIRNDADQISRRTAIKGLAVGTGVITTLPILNSGSAAAQELAHDHSHSAAQAAAPQPLRFFTEPENRAVIEMTERIIPADDHSPGAKAARVSEYIDLIVSESPDGTKQTWREGLKAIDKISQDKFSKPFADASEQQQIELLKEISKNEKNPTTVEERFFRTVKNATIDGYYTSEIGIHKELHYKGNSFMKEFVGCTHPEHQS